jgi:hypothetical protein
MVTPKAGRVWRVGSRKKTSSYGLQQRSRKKRLLEEIRIRSHRHPKADAEPDPSSQKTSGGYEQVGLKPNWIDDVPAIKPGPWLRVIEPLWFYGLA